MWQLRGAESELSTQLSMASTAETELSAALQAAEREVVATRERGERRVEEVEAQRKRCAATS